MKNRYMSILYVGMVFTAFAAGFHGLDRLGRPFPLNPVKEQSASAVPAEIQRAALPKAALPETTLSDIRNVLEKQEYHISYDAQKKKLQSPNRNHNIRAYYEPGKLTVQTRVDTMGEGFKLELANEGVFADGKLLCKPEANAKPDYHENKVLISHEAFSEEFINNEEGVRQNFIIKKAPEGTRQLQIKMTAKGLRVEQGSGNELHFYSEAANGQTGNKLVYSDLKCWDANKHPLNANLAYVDNHIQISVDVAKATYPVTIDPIIANGTPQNANKVLEVNQSNMWLGFSVSSAGDVNGDGYSDVIVGAPQYDLGQDNEGAAFIYPGSASGLTLNAVTLECNQAGAKMGYSVASAGDFNGDGFSDVLVGIPYYDKDAIDEGRANLYLGSGTFFTSAITAYGMGCGRAGALMGINVATAGDIDGDGFSDILIAASQDSNGQSKEGSVTIKYGNAATDLSTSAMLQFNQANAMFGYSVAPAGDVDADGFSDIIVGARYYTNGQGEDAEGAAFIYRGSNGGLITNNPTIIEGNQYNAAMGNKVSSAGDVNGDGYSDVLISAYLYDYTPNLKDEGIVYLHMGSDNGIDPVPIQGFKGNQNDARMGSSVACAGDVNGDGFSDILLGAQYYDNGQLNEGVVYVFHGSKNALFDSPASMLESNQANGWFGTAVASAGDVNGDGYSDILVGCYTFDNGQTDEGHVFVYHGGAAGVGYSGSSEITSNNTGAKIGFSVAAAGDINADGYSDVIVGAPYYDLGEANEGIAFVYYGSQSGLTTNTYHILQENIAGARFGNAVSGAGDVNGDGFDDIVVGADCYSNGQEHEGAVFIYHGSVTGVAIQAAIHFERNFAESNMGRSVARAGDVNRDGYSDIIVGASGVKSAYVYQGSVNGITDNPEILQDVQYNDDSKFGNSVASAGDVNGDGYDDVIVGDDWYGSGDVGAAHIFHGSSTGIATTAAVTLEGAQDYTFMGSSVAGTGDINGDGYSDVIVGAPSHDNGQQEEGVVLIYYGSSTGISNNNPAMLEINKTLANFGFAVNGAGDVNGDGYNDIIIGAPHFSDGQTYEGAVYIFHGSPTGVKTTAAFQLENTNISFAHMGFAVAGAGDVNGDGYSDVLAGSTEYLNGQNETGSAFVYYGNNGKGLKNNVRLFNSDLVTPLNHSQFNQPNFIGTLSAKSFIGRNKGKFVWETMGPGVPFSKVENNPITTSNQSTGTSVSFTNMSGFSTVMGSSITKTGVATRFRVRVRYSPVLAITGQMFGPWRYLQSQLAGYNSAPVPEEVMAETIKRKAEQEIETSISLFPNPASDRLYIQVADPSDIRSVRLFNTSGTPVFQSQRYESDIDVSKLPGGIYTLLLNRASGTSTSHRILIQR